MLAVLVAAAVFTATALAAPPRERGGGGGGNSGGGETFDITGSVSGLLPTISSTLDITIEHTGPRPIRVIDLTIAIGDPPGPCAPEDLVLVPPALPIDVPARDEVTVVVEARLADGVRDACQGATWDLTYTGTAERA